MDSYELQRRAEAIVRERTHWQECPIELDDKRFDFSKIIPKSQKQTGPICPIEFIGNNINPYI